MLLYALYSNEYHHIIIRHQTFLDSTNHYPPHPNYPVLLGIFHAHSTSHSAPCYTALPISTAIPFYTLTEPIPVGIIRWLTHHEGPRPTVINIQALLDVIAHRLMRRSSFGRGGPASARSGLALNGLGLGAVILAFISKMAGASDWDA
jgi:hypothetical protein